MKPKEALRQVIEESGMSVSEVSRRMGNHPQTLINSLNKTKHLGSQLYADVMDVLGYDVVVKCCNGVELVIDPTGRTTPVEEPAPKLTKAEVTRAMLTGRMSLVDDGGTGCSVNDGEVILHVSDESLDDYLESRTMAKVVANVLESANKCGNQTRRIIRGIA